MEWAKVELMGHVCLAGRLTEVERFGTKMGRLDIPLPPKQDCLACKGTGIFVDAICRECEAYVTQFFGGASVYRITMVTEQVARQIMRRQEPAPVSAWDFPKQALPAPVHDRVMSCGHTPESCDCEIEGEGDDDEHPIRCAGCGQFECGCDDEDEEDQVLSADLDRTETRETS